MEKKMTTPNESATILQLREALQEIQVHSAQPIVDRIAEKALADTAALAASPQPAPGPTCKWADCMSEKERKDLADEIYRDLYSGEPAPGPSLNDALLEAAYQYSTGQTLRPQDRKLAFDFARHVATLAAPQSPPMVKLAGFRVRSPRTNKARLMDKSKGHLMDSWERAGYEVTKVYELSASLAAPATVDRNAVGTESDDPSEREALIACLEDDAAKLEDGNPGDEMAQTMREAAAMLEADALQQSADKPAEGES
jgi:hypothetical protein